MPSLQEIEKLIVKGMVLDEHGNWVPLTNKVKKEREFISHLERGEVLFNGEWRKISEVKELIQQNKIKKREEEVAEEETAIISLIKTPEETVSFSTETIFDMPLKKKEDEVDDFPPETKIITFEKEKEEEANPTLVKKDEKTEERKHSSTLNSEIEFEETVLYDVEMLKKKIETEKRLHYKSYSDVEKIFSPYSVKKRKSQQIWSFLLIILFITIVIILLLLRF
ncbi:MAG: hypothetical protein N2053_11255 [Chitinispirillaceae bacterium]|nr:hypothetical protein [Chitinispirillaceae bacterium]